MAILLYCYEVISSDKHSLKEAPTIEIARFLLGILQRLGEIQLTPMQV
jgi:hypothetical protein